MNISVFVIAFVIESIIASLLTQAIKKAMENAKKDYSANVIALIVAFVIGIGVTVGYMIFNSIPFTAQSVIIVVAMTGCVWMGAMLGYDKVKQALEQIAKIK